MKITGYSFNPDSMRRIISRETYFVCVLRNSQPAAGIVLPCFVLFVCLFVFYLFWVF